MTDTRPTGITLRLLDTDSLNAKVSEQLKDTYEVGFAPYAVAEATDGTLYVVCSEGVGWPVTDEQPLDVGLYRKAPNRIAIAPKYQLKLTPAEVRELITDTEVDLADHIRRFGARLEGNFWSWYRRLSA